MLLDSSLRAGTNDAGVDSALICQTTKFYSSFLQKKVLLVQFLTQYPAALNGILLMLVATVLLASMHSIVRYLTADLHPFVIVFFRSFFGLVAILPLVAKSGIGVLRTAHPKLHLIRVSVGMLAMLSWFYALSRVPVTNATALSFSSTIFATLAAWLILGERMRIRRWLAILTGLIGVVVVLRPGLEGFNVFALLVIASTMAWGTSVTIVKKLSKTESTTCIITWMGIGLSVLSLGPALLFWQWPDPQQMSWLLLVGILASGGHYCMTSALRLTDTAVVMSVDFMRLIWTSIIGYIFFADLLDRWTLAGAIIIFASAWYIIFRESRLTRLNPDATENTQVVGVTTATSISKPGARHRAD